MICKKCGHDDDNFSSCGKCGTSKPLFDMKCGKCGKEDGNFDACGECGTSKPQSKLPSALYMKARDEARKKAEQKIGQKAQGKPCPFCKQPLTEGFLDRRSKVVPVYDYETETDIVNTGRVLISGDKYSGYVVEKETRTHTKHKKGDFLYNRVDTEEYAFSGCDTCKFKIIYINQYEGKEGTKFENHKKTVEGSSFWIDKSQSSKSIKDILNKLFIIKSRKYTVGYNVKNSYAVNPQTFKYDPATYNYKTKAEMQTKYFAPNDSDTVVKEIFGMRLYIEGSPYVPLAPMTESSMFTCSYVNEYTEYSPASGAPHIFMGEWPRKDAPPPELEQFFGHASEKKGFLQKLFGKK